MRPVDLKWPYALTARSLLLWSLGGTLAIELFLRAASRYKFTPIFAHLLYSGDAVGNWVLMMLVCGAYLLRRHAKGVLAAIQAAGSHPWTVAAVLFPLLCAGALRVYHDHPLSMDEYAAVFQAKAFAAGRLTGTFPPELLDALIPVKFQNYFLTVSRATGEASSTYWPGFALLMAPFAWLDAPWALNPALGALSVPVVHRLTREVTGSNEAAAWAAVFAAASPVIVVSSISYYSMQAHLVCNMLFALLLLRPTVPRAVAAGMIGSFALTLHQPVPHLLFLLPFACWLAMRPGSRAALVALGIGYLPLGLLLGLGWQIHLVELARSGAVATVSAIQGASSLAESSVERVVSNVVLPGATTLWARIAGLTKIWTWGAAALMVLAAYGYAAERSKPAIKLLGAAVVLTYFGYFLFPMDQGHGWGYRYFHSAWFVLPVLAAAGLLAVRGTSGDELRGMAAWLVVLSFVFANALRLAEVRAFVADHLAQVPPLVRVVPQNSRQVVFVRVTVTSYLADLVQNDPLLRAARIIMVYEGAEAAADLMRRRFPDYVREFSGDWGELWTARQPTQGR